MEFAAGGSVSPTGSPSCHVPRDISFTNVVLSTGLAKRINTNTAHIIKTNSYCKPGFVESASKGWLGLESLDADLLGVLICLESLVDLL